MLVAAFNKTMKEPQILRRGITSRHNWSIDLWVRIPKERVTITIKTRRCLLPEAIKESITLMNQLIEENPTYLNAGFSVIRLR